MDIEEAREIIDNMSEQELNDFIFFALQEVEKENQKLKTELEKKEAIINEMAKFIAGLDIDELICKDREHCTGDYEYETCEECIKEYFTKKAEKEGK